MGMKYLIILSVLVLNTRLSSQYFIYQVVNGSLNEDHQFNYSITSDIFEGIILHCVDSIGSLFEMYVSPGTSQTKIKVTFNKRNKYIQLKDLCSCDPCHNKTMQFFIRINTASVEVRCNHGPTKKLCYHEVSVFNKLIIPEIISNKSDKIFISIGNHGPYRINGREKNPDKAQLYGCLRNFFYDRQKILFIEEGTKMRRSCSNICSEDICNGGICEERVNGIICDCSMTILNGKYCNKSLIQYNDKSNISYGNRQNASELYLKLSWKILIDNKFCLLEIVRRVIKTMISVEAYNLLLDSKVIASINKDKINFLIISASNNQMVIKTSNKTISIPFSVNDNIRINVGFSERKNICETFDGAYDIYVNSGWKQIKIPTTSKTTPFNLQTLTKRSSLQRLSMMNTALYFQGEKVKFWDWPTTIGYILLLAVSVTFVTIIFKRTKRCLFNQHQPIEFNQNKEEDSEDNYYSSMNYDGMYSDHLGELTDGYIEPNNHQGDDDTAPNVPAILLYN